MKTIRIISLELINFKGIKHLKLDELGLEAFIYGDNGTGKTSIFDAFTWLLFGKDSSDRKDFEIKTLDSKNNVIPKIDHEVIANIDVDGQSIELRRIFKEKWVTRRGSLDAEFTGNETLYEWNGVPMNAGEYTSKINQIVDEKVFKMITNPWAFNSLKWQDQRDVLIDMVGEVSDRDIASGNSEFEKLVDKMEIENKSVDDLKKQFKASISKSKKEIQSIPTRIDEVERAKPEPLDYVSLKKELTNKETDLDGINDQISNKLKAQEAIFEKQKGIRNDIFEVEAEIQSKKHELQNKASDIYSEAASKPREFQRELDNIDKDIERNEQTIAIRKQNISGQNHRLKTLEQEITEIRNKWKAENAKEFSMDENECKCPTCKREFDAKDLEEKRQDLEQHFISNKKASLKTLSESGINLTSQKESIENQIQSLDKDVKRLEGENLDLWKKRADISEQLKSANSGKSQTSIYEELVSDNASFFKEKEKSIETLKTSLSENAEVDVTELKSKRDALRGEIQNLESQLATEKEIEKHNIRIKQLSEEEKSLAQTIANLEKELYVIEGFEKAKSDAIETSVNERFKYVNFKLFETQINGGEVPTCKALIDGVPFSDANTASKINAGLDIINTLCNHYQVNAPIFIDNRESVVQLINIESQIINLVVSESDKKLRVETKVESLTA